MSKNLPCLLKTVPIPGRYCTHRMDIISKLEISNGFWQLVVQEMTSSTLLVSFCNILAFQLALWYHQHYKWGGGWNVQHISAPETICDIMQDATETNSKAPQDSMVKNVSAQYMPLCTQATSPTCLL